MLYLIQHGEANDANIDPERDLSPIGELHARQAGRFLSKCGISVESIWHSGKLRALHTALILAAEIGASEGVSYRVGLLPGDDPRLMIGDIVAHSEGGLMIVGHLPFLQGLSEELLGGSRVHFRNAGIVAISEHNRDWALDWAVVPELFEKEPFK
jgi:phosphohistidine phosphatase SixA